MKKSRFFSVTVTASWPLSETDVATAFRVWIKARTYAEKKVFPTAGIRYFRQSVGQGRYRVFVDGHTRLTGRGYNETLSSLRIFLTQFFY